MKHATSLIAIVTSGLSLASLAQSSTSGALKPELAAAFPESPALVKADEQPMAPADVVPAGSPAASVGRMDAGKAWAAASNRKSLGQVSVLCFKVPDQQELGETTEDIAVLAHLLSRNLEHAFARDASDYKLGIPMLLTSGNQTVGASYIQGFGAIFRMQVRFPLVSAGDGIDEAEGAQTGSEWENARRELMAEDNSGTSYGAARDVYSSYEASGQPYDAKLVQTLRKRVLALLKNASNLRHLDGNEWIMIKIVGTPNSSNVLNGLWGKGDPKTRDEGEIDAKETASLTPRDEASKGQPANSRRAKASSKHPAGNVKIATDSNQPTIMSLRVKKSAVDAFASGSLSEEQFMKSAEVAAYVNPVPPDNESEGGVSLNSMLGGGVFRKK
jgi:hypothetical protein